MAHVSLSLASHIQSFNACYRHRSHVASRVVCYGVLTCRQTRQIVTQEPQAATLMKDKVLVPVAASSTLAEPKRNIEAQASCFICSHLGNSSTQLLPPHR